MDENGEEKYGMEKQQGSMQHPMALQNEGLTWERKIYVR